MTGGNSRTVISIFLLLALTVPFVATYSWLQYSKHQTQRTIKWRMIAGMPREELELLKLSKKEAATKLRWEHSKEFEYNHQMYDVVDVITKGDSVYYWCWWDNEETVLNKQLDQLVASAFSGDARHHESRTRLNDFMKEFYYCDDTGNSKPHGIQIIIPSAFLSANNPAVFSAPLSPPPECA